MNFHGFTGTGNLWDKKQSIRFSDDLNLYPEIFLLRNIYQIALHSLGDDGVIDGPDFNIVSHFNIAK